MKNIIFLLLSLILICGCTTPSFTYPPPNTTCRQYTNAPLQKTLKVLPFKNCRRRNDDISHIYLAFIPLFPYGWMNYNYPETGRTFITIQKFIFNPETDLAKSAAYHIQQANLFSETFFTYDSKAISDYTLKGEIYSLEYEGQYYTYGLTIASYALWLLGFPIGESTNKLNLKLTLYDNNNNIIYSEKCVREKYIPQNYWYNCMDDCSMYAELYYNFLNKYTEKIQNRL